MTNGYIVELERLRVQLRDTLRLKGETIDDDATLQELIPLVANIDITQDFASFCKGNEPFSIIDNEGLITSIRDSAFYNSANNIDTLYLPKCEKVATRGFSTTSVKHLTIGTEIPNGVTCVLAVTSFMSCKQLEDIKGGVTSVSGIQTFDSCSALKVAEFDSLIAHDRTFPNCTSLKIIDMGNTTKICDSNSAWFGNCSSLLALVIRSDSVASGVGANCLAYLSSIPNCKIYVKDELVEDYKSTNIWSTWADRITPLSEYDRGAILNG